MSSDISRFHWGSRLRWVIAGALAVLSLLVVVAFALPGDQGGTGSAAAATTTTPAPSDPALATPPPLSPAPTGPTSDATALPSSQPAVPLDGVSTVEEVEVSLVGIEEIQGQANGPGDVAGPALRITVRLENGTDDPLDLLAVSVAVAHGVDLVPASPLGDPSAAPFSGTLEPGKSAQGVYVVRVPVDARDAVTVSVGYRPGAPFAVFTGAV
jgi:hypothetical protein